MILPAQRIRDRCVPYHSGWDTNERYLEVRGPMISPFCERTVHAESGMSYGLSACSYDVRLDQDVTVRKGYMTLASTIERICMPNDLCCTVRDKSSLVRRGLTVQNTHLDPGWSGYLTLELLYHPLLGDSNIILLDEGQPVAQLVFEQLTEFTEQPYAGKYQDQERGPQMSRREIA